jgi:UDP-2-acetamido-2-deoxy-ribo-hexuluronate aminotransferase
MQFIDLKQQYELIKPEVLFEINQVLDSGHYIMGEQVFQLEELLAQFTGAAHCIGVCDGTKALLIALMALGIKPGDEVIVPAFTFVATASMVVLLGATPVFVDIDEKTYNLDPSKLHAAITEKTAAIIPVSLYGQCADYAALKLIAGSIPIIEDGAQSFGASYQGRRSGNLSQLASTSFFPSKPLGCYGDGGAIFTSDEELAQKMRFIRIHGQDKRYHHALLGINGRLDTIQAAVLLAKLRIFPQEIALRQQVAQHYDQLFAESRVITPYIAPGNTSVYAQYTLLVPDRDGLIKHLNAAGIPSAVHYPIPLHQQPIFAKFYRQQDLTIAEKIAAHVLSLPMHPYLKLNVQEQIAAVVKQFVDQA